MSLKKRHEKIQINTIADLRRHAVQVLEKLDDGEIETEDAATTCKMYGSIIDSLRVELEYNRMQSNQKKIEFLEQREVKDVVDQDKVKQLELKSTTKWGG